MNREDLKDIWAHRFASEVVKQRDVVNGVLVFKGLKPFTDEELLEIAERGIEIVKEAKI